MEKLNSMVQPVGHGTTSEYLEGILVNGLGQELPVREFMAQKVLLI